MAPSSWMLVLSLWVVSALKTTGEVTTVKADTDCKIVFTAKSPSEVFEESCDPITFPCSNKPNGGYYAVPDNCEFSFRCVYQSVRKCKSPTNTGFDIDADRFIHRFDANCTCPNGFKSSKTSTTTTVLAPTSQGETGGIVGGVIALVVVVIVVVIIVIVLRRRNKARSTREDKSDVCRGDTVQDDRGVCRVNSVQSDTYDELKEVDPTYDNAMPVANKSNLSTLNRGPLPEVPDVDVPADDTYLRLTGDFTAGDAENATLANGKRDTADASDSVYLTPVTKDSGNGHDNAGSINNGQP